MWVTLPPGVDSDGVHASAHEAGIALVRGSGAFLDGRGRECRVLAFVLEEAGRIAEGIREIATRHRRVRRSA